MVKYFILLISCLLCSADAVNITLGSCASFAAQAGTAVSFGGSQTTIYTGDIGVAPGTAISGNVVLLRLVNQIRKTSDHKMTIRMALILRDMI
jgi:hypothetical protein